MTEPLKAEDIPADLRDIARAAFSGQPPRADGSLLLDTGRNPWRALDDALAAVMPRYEALVRAKVSAEIANDARDVADEFQRPFPDLVGDAATLRWFADRIASEGRP